MATATAAQKQAIITAITALRQDLAQVRARNAQLRDEIRQLRAAKGNTSPLAAADPMPPAAPLTAPAPAGQKMVLQPGDTVAKGAVFEADGNRYTVKEIEVTPQGLRVVAEDANTPEAVRGGLYRTWSPDRFEHETGLRLPRPEGAAPAPAAADAGERYEPRYERQNETFYRRNNRGEWEAITGEPVSVPGVEADLLLHRADGAHYEVVDGRTGLVLGSNFKTADEAREKTTASLTQLGQAGYDRKINERLARVPRGRNLSPRYQVANPPTPAQEQAQLRALLEAKADVHPEDLAAYPDLQDEYGIYAVGARVTLPDGRHGAVVKAVGWHMAALGYSGLGGGSEYSYMYDVQTDNGAVVSASSGKATHHPRLEKERPDPAAVIPDPVLDGKPVEPDYLYRSAMTDYQYAKSAREAAGRARKPEKQRAHERQARDYEAKAQKQEGVWQAWAKQHPEAAAKVEQAQVSYAKNAGKYVAPPPVAAPQTATPMAATPQPATAPAAPVAGGVDNTGETGATGAGGVRASFNAEKNGVEIRLGRKPTPAESARMKANGFRATNRTGEWVWYAKQGPRTSEFARNFAGVKNCEGCGNFVAKDGNGIHKDSCKLRGGGEAAPMAAAALPAAPDAPPMPVAAPTATPAAPMAPDAPDTLYQAVQYLAGRDDGARKLDGMGFNKFDTSFGNSLADVPAGRWTPGQRAAAYGMVRKYRNQLAGAGIDYDTIPAPVTDEAEAAAAAVGVTPQVVYRPAGDGVEFGVQSGNQVVFRDGRATEFEGGGWAAVTPTMRETYQSYTGNGRNGQARDDFNHYEANLTRLAAQANVAEAQAAETALAEQVASNLVAQSTLDPETGGAQVWEAALQQAEAQIAASSPAPVSEAAAPVAESGEPPAPVSEAAPAAESSEPPPPPTPPAPPLMGFNERGEEVRVGTVIWEQMPLQTRMSVGAQRPTLTHDGIEFYMNASDDGQFIPLDGTGRNHKIRVAYNAGADDYTVERLRVYGRGANRRWVVERREHGVYFDQFDAVVMGFCDEKPNGPDANSPDYQDFAHAIGKEGREERGISKCDVCGRYVSREGEGHNQEAHAGKEAPGRADAGGGPAGSGAAAPPDGPLSDKIKYVREGPPAGKSPIEFDAAEASPATAPTLDAAAPTPPPTAEAAPAAAAFEAAPPTLNTTPLNIGDFAVSPENDETHGVFTPKQRYQKNVAAIRLLKQLEAENRAATPEEQAVLAQYTSWGAIQEAFAPEDNWIDINERFPDRPTYWRDVYGAIGHKASYTWQWEEEHDDDVTGDAGGVYQHSPITPAGWKAFKAWYQKRKPQWVNEQRELRALLTQPEYEAANKTVMNAHYTSPTVYRAVYESLAQMGISAADASPANPLTVVEPFCGNGNAFGTMPADLAAVSRKVGVELDDVTARICAKLYPNAAVQSCGTQDARLPDNSADLVITNVPFSDNGMPADPAYQTGLRKKVAKSALHNWGIAKCLDKAKPGGLVAVITSRYTMDAPQNEFVRQYLADQADLVSAVRLPAGTFAKNAGTEVVTDVLYFRKRKPGEPVGEAAWVKVGETKDHKKKPMQINQYFIDHPERMAGRMEVAEHGMHGANEPTLVSDGRPLGQAIREAHANMPKNVTGPGTGKCGKCGNFVSATGEGHKTNPPCGLEGQPVATIPSAAAPTPGISLEAAVEVDKKYEGVESANFVAKDGLMYRVDEEGKAVLHPGYRGRKPAKGAAEPEAVQRVRAMLPLVDNAVALYNANRNLADDAAFDAARQEMNAAYDAFVEQWGPIHAKANLKAMGDDPNFSYLLGLEEFDLSTEQARKAALMEHRTLAPAVLADKAESASEAMAIALAESAQINWARMSGLTSRPIESLQAELLEKGAVYRTPEGGWATADEYLSGNVRQKLKQARDMAAIAPEFRSNVAALEAVMPVDVQPEDIFVKLGVNWVTPDEMSEFARQMFGVSIPVTYVEGLGWGVHSPPDKWAKAQIKSNARINRQWGMTHVNERLNGLKLLEQALNGQRAEVKVKGCRKCETCKRGVWPNGKGHAADCPAGHNCASCHRKIENNGNGHTRECPQRGQPVHNPVAPSGERDRTFEMVNEEASLEAQEKQRQMHEEFRKWLWADPNRRAEIGLRYNELRNSYVPRKYNGAHLAHDGHTPGMSVDAPQMRGHQLDGAWRMMQGENAFLAYGVGAGKTYTGIMGLMELKRIGRVKRPAVSVPKAVLNQWARDFRTLYPAAKVLMVNQSDISSNDEKKRREFLARVASSNPDVIVFTHEAFQRVPLEAATYERYIADDIRHFKEMLEGAEDEMTQKQIQKVLDRLEGRLAEQRLKATSKQDKHTLTLEALGIDYMAVDEAHLFKNVSVASTRRNIRGLAVNRDPAGRAWDMQMKIRHLREANGGQDKGVSFLSGTPFPNALHEVYVMSDFLMHQRYSEAGLGGFDEFANSYTEEVSSVEAKATGKGYEVVNSFSGVRNLRELGAMLSGTFDVRMNLREMGLKLPELKGGKPNTVAAAASPEQSSYIDFLCREAETNLTKENNMLVIVGKGRKCALDMRLLNTEELKRLGIATDPNVLDSPNSKVNQCLAKVMENYRAGTGVKLPDPQQKGAEITANTTQLIFCDMGVPKNLRAKEKVIPPSGKVCSDCGKRRTPDVPCLFGREPQSCPVDPLYAPPGEEDDHRFDLYTDMKQKLVAQGVPPDEIAFIQDYNTDDAKAELYAKVNAGKVRVVIGSTASMGVGVNFQRLQCASHMLTLPWRPDQLEQAEGRVVRQGNLNPTVEVNRYVTQNTFDVYIAQTNERKSRFNHKILDAIANPENAERAANDDDVATANIAMLKASAMNDSRLMDKLGLENQVRVYAIKEKAHQAEVFRSQQRLNRLPGDIDDTTRRIEKLQAATKLVGEARTAEEKTEAAAKQEIREAREWRDQCKAKVKELETAVADQEKAAKKAGGAEPAELTQARTDLTTWQDRLQTAEEVAKTKSELTGFSMRLSGRDIRRAEDAMNSLREVQQRYWGENGTPGQMYEVGQWNGLPIVVEAANKDSHQAPSIYLRIGDEIAPIVRGEALPPTGAANMQRFRSALHMPEAHLRSERDRLESLRKEEAPLREMIEKPFEFSGMLQDMRDRLAALDKELGFDKMTQYVASDNAEEGEAVADKPRKGKGKAARDEDEAEEEE